MKFKIVKLFFIVICILVFCTLAVTVGLAVYVNKNIDFKAVKINS